jgi:antitoxin ParD1/3/4
MRGAQRFRGGQGGGFWSTMAACMANGMKLRVTVTAEMAAWIAEAVDSSEYASASDVVHEALLVLRRSLRERDRLRTLWAEGVASGGAAIVTCRRGGNCR